MTVTLVTDQNRQPGGQNGRSRLQAARRYGRKSLLTPSVSKTITDAVSSGSSAEVAAQAAGVTSRTLRRWRERGAAGEKLYADFEQQLAEAWATRLVQLATVVMKGAIQDPRLALEVLGRLDHTHWGRRDQLALSGPNGGPLVEPVHYDVSKLTEREKATLTRLVDKLLPPVKELVEGETVDRE